MSSVGQLATVAALVSACGSGNLQPDEANPWGEVPAPTPVPGLMPTTANTNPSPAPTNGETTVAPSPSGTVPGVVPSTPTGAQPPAPPPATPTCQAPTPGRSPLRRLTRFEYSRTMQALLGAESEVGQELPAELLGNGFGNDADNQPSSAFLIEQYATLAPELAARAVLPDIATRYDSCVGGAPADEASCARSFISKFAEAAYRRPLQVAEQDELLALQQALRPHGDFAASITGVVEAVLQSPDFLYRVEFGEASATPGVRQLTGHEMASRLSYFMWGAPPDAALLEAATSGALNTPDGVLTQAKRLLDDPMARRVVEFFFDSYLPINNLTDQTRDRALFPTFSAEIGSLQREETQQFLMHEIFEGEGSWDSVLTAPYTLVNQKLAEFYGISGVAGDAFVKVDLDTTKRLGLLTQASVLTGTTVTNITNPVRRGGFLLSHVLCVDVPLPPEELLEEIKPPEESAGLTGRERYSAHSRNEQCASCHALLDPPGFALENFDAVGLWRDQENGVTIDATGSLGSVGTFSGPVELIQQIAASENTHACFAQQWQKFGYGRKLDAKDQCNKQQLVDAFERSGHNVKELLVAITQTDGFRFLSAEEQL